MSFWPRIVALVISVCVFSGTALAQELRGLSRIVQTPTAQHSQNLIEISVPLDLAVPYRIYQLADPYRIVIDTQEVDWTGFTLPDVPWVETFRFGRLDGGWSRLVLTLSAPFALQSASMQSALGQSGLDVTLARKTAAEFAATVRVPKNAQNRPRPDITTAPPARRQTGEALRILLDPGHGGIDPGAEVGGKIEADLMLEFAIELAELLRRSGNIDVQLTRTEDVFVPLEARVAAAHAFGAHLFVSLHADIVTEGNASGATIYTLSDAASDIASQKLAERHDRTELLSGVDLTLHDDVVAFVLMDMARTDTTHRSKHLAGALVDALGQSITLYKKPHQFAGFSVLKSPDIPSVLIELGFMSSKHDLKNITDPKWRARAATSIRDGLILWALEDEAQAELRGN